MHGIAAEIANVMYNSSYSHAESIQPYCKTLFMLC